MFWNLKVCTVLRLSDFNTKIITITPHTIVTYFCKISRQNTWKMSKMLYCDEIRKNYAMINKINLTTYWYLLQTKYHAIRLNTA